MKYSNIFVSFEPIYAFRGKYYKSIMNISWVAENSDFDFFMAFTETAF